MPKKGDINSTRIAIISPLIDYAIIRKKLMENKNMFPNISIKNTLMESLGINIVEVKNGVCIATMPVDERTKQPFGYLHGGASVALAETAASVGAASLIDAKKQAVFGQEINANHIRSVKEGIVTATATVIHQGKSSMVYEIKVENDKKELICISRCTLAVISLER